MTNNTGPHYWSDWIEPDLFFDICENKLKELGNFLADSSLSDGCTSIAMADGFLTALVVGPTNVPREPSQGLELVWGEISDIPMEERAWSQQKLDMWHLLFSRMNEIAQHIEFDRAAYAPIFHSYLGAPMTFAERVQEIPPVIEWCRGFMKYFEIDPDSWATIFAFEEGRTLMTPIIYFGSDSGWRTEIDNKFKVQARHVNRFSENIQDLVLGIADYSHVPYFVEETRRLKNFITRRWSVPMKYAQMGDLHKRP